MRKNPRLSEGWDPADFDPVQLQRGTDVEMEHTDDREEAQRIAMDHLVEDPDYYEKLELVESGADIVSLPARRMEKSLNEKLSFLNDIPSVQDAIGNCLHDLGFQDSYIEAIVGDLGEAWANDDELPLWEVMRYTGIVVENGVAKTLGVFWELPDGEQLQRLLRAAGIKGLGETIFITDSVTNQTTTWLRSIRKWGDWQ